MDDGLISRLLSPVSRAIENYCHRTFFTADEDRSYDWPQDGYLRLRDSVVAVTQITTNAGQTLTASQLRLRPQAGPPYYEIHPKIELGYVFNYSVTPMDALTVTATWGYKASVPEEIELAAKTWIAEIYNHSDMRGLESTSGGAIQLKVTKLTKDPPDDVALLLNPFRKRQIWQAGGNVQSVRILA